MISYILLIFLTCSEVEVCHNSVKRVPLVLVFGFGVCLFVGGFFVCFLFKAFSVKSNVVT